MEQENDKPGWYNRMVKQQQQQPRNQSTQMMTKDARILGKL